MRDRITRAALVPVCWLGCTAEPAFAADALDGKALGWPWALPFIGILLTIATGPLLFKAIWHHHYRLFALGWAAALLIPMVFFQGGLVAVSAFVHAALAEYLGFITLLFALYVTAGGVLVTGELRGTPLTNTAILAFGTLIAGIVGTTGAAMILIRPLLRANAHRTHNVHVVVFFIILVCNIGGALTPLGDPPLFLGFLRGVDFFWTTKYLLAPTMLASVILLVAFVMLDLWYARNEPAVPRSSTPSRLGLRGTINLLLIALIILVILASAIWQPGISFRVLGTEITLQNLARNIALWVIALASLWWTPKADRVANGFSWGPIREVAILFAAIFVCIIPVLAMLGAGHEGFFSGLLDAVTTPDGQPRNMAYFWLSGSLSAFLDNAPTYLVFFELAGGDAKLLMTTLAPTLTAISMGAVYMGALTYIGNAPNFMVSAVASESGVRMPSFFGFMLWSCAILLPVLLLLSLIWF